jgi:ABC-2 type transport system permease protein/sodium transport system permease protein
MPSSKLAGPMLVTPVANMVLLTRELLLNVPIASGVIVWVLLSTTLYAVAAVAIAAKVFGSESVVFADSASMKSAFQRKLFKPAHLPTASMALLVVGLLFPLWFYLQSYLQSGLNTEKFFEVVARTVSAMPVVFMLIPIAVCWYWKINVVDTFALRPPSLRYLVSASVIGIAAWFPVHELIVFLKQFAPPEAIGAGKIDTGDVSIVTLIVVLALIPAFCEEFLFRGFFLSGLRTRLRKWWALLVVGCVFGLFHIELIRLPVTAMVGLLLGYLCWQSRSIWPAILAHGLHNSMGVLIPYLWEQRPELGERFGVTQDQLFDSYLPFAVSGGAVVLVAAAMLLCRRPPEETPAPAPATFW